MDYSRRSFMFMLGAGGLAAAAGSKLVPLFGSDEQSKLIVPDPTMTRGHFTVYPKPLIEKAHTPTVAGSRHDYIGAHVVARLTPLREPRKPLITREGSFLETARLPEGTAVRDAHTAFYMASRQIRTAFSKFSTHTLSEIPPVQRPFASLVTILDAPIHVRPSLFDDAVFDVACEFKQFVVIGMPRAEIETFQIYSEQGEYPIEIPHDVDLGRLLHMDCEVLRVVPTDTRSLNTILSSMSSWKS